MLEKIFRRNKQKTNTMHIAGLQGQESVAQLEKALSSIGGVSEVAVSLGEEKIKITYDTAQITIPALQAAIKESGFEVQKPVHGEDGNCCGGCT